MKSTLNFVDPIGNPIVLSVAKLFSRSTERETQRENGHHDDKFF